MPGGTRTFLTFALGGEEYGVPVAQVKEIVGMMPFTAVPAPQAASGGRCISGATSFPSWTFGCGCSATRAPPPSGRASSF